MLYHTPVLLHVCIDALIKNPSGIYVDATFGGGGHSREILNRLDSQGQLVGFDQDPDAANNAIDDPRFSLLPYNFRYLKNYLKLFKAFPVDGVLADLGVSSHQFDTDMRGFSIRFDAPLDMRMDTKQELDAKKLIATWPEEDLRNMLRMYGDIKEAGKLARHITNVRSDNKIETTGKLMEIIKPFARRGQENQFAAQVFQAIRIAVNDELHSLQQLLLQCAEVIKPGGRMVIMSYHSLEDRLVKNFIRSGKFEGEPEKDLFGNSDVPFKAINRKPIRPTDEEIKTNNRSRSAVLRIAQRN
jgi:16S rRNA (cytosine1402-N4)-methyltransferase